MTLCHVTCTTCHVIYRSSPADTGEEQHESIVREIEEALRKEIHAASMLTERPRWGCEGVGVWGGGCR